MAYDGKVMRRAVARFQEDKQRRSEEFSARKQRLYGAVPRLGEIERELGSTLSQIITGALAKGTDPLPAIRVIRDKNLDLQRERMDLLRTCGYPTDYLEEKPACPLCGDTGYNKSGVCRCLQRYYDEEQIRELSKMLDLGNQTFDNFDLDWYSTEPDEKWGRSPRATMEMVYEVCVNYARQFGPDSDNLFLSGAPGLGKTFLSACIARVVSDRGFSVVYDTAAHIFSQMEAVRFRRDEDVSEAAEDVARYENCDLLILDDLGTEMTTSFVQGALYEIVNGRLLNGKKTIISSNLTGAKIGKRYSVQVQSRLDGEYKTLYFLGQDIRALKKERAGNPF